MRSCVVIALAAALASSACVQNANVPWSNPATPGTGVDGPLDIASGSTVTLDNCLEIVSVSGSNVIVAGPVTEGREFLFWQAQAQFATSGDQAAITESGAISDAAAWQTSKITNVVDNLDGTYTATMNPAPLANFETLAGRSSHGCLVQDYTDVTIAAGALLTATPWNGTSGGMIVIKASGTVTIDGIVSATGAGFRGAISQGQNGGNDTDFDSPDGGGKGESLDGRSYAMTGRGNYANGGGGGNAHNAGGGGGGNGGAGGLGGKEYEFAGNGGLVDTQGMPGVAIDLSVWQRCSFGGGGGSGEEHHGTSGAGGTGGGLIVIIAPVITGTGAIEANGLAGESPAEDGGGGGGAGGTVVLVPDPGGGQFSGIIAASGGDGGNAFTNYAEGVGPGGGGGGGHVFVQDGFTNATIELDAGMAGETELADGTVTNWFATDGEPGVLETP